MTRAEELYEKLYSTPEFRQGVVIFLPSKEDAVKLLQTALDEHRNDVLEEAAKAVDEQHILYGGTVICMADEKISDCIVNLMKEIK